MTICQNNHEPIVYAGEDKCPLCLEMESNRILYKDVVDLQEEVKDLTIKLKAIKSYIEKELPWQKEEEKVHG